MENYRWTHSPIKARPLRFWLLVLLVLLVASLLVYWLGAGQESLVLSVLFVFSLREGLFSSSISASELDLTLSAPLTGAKSLGWSKIAHLKLEGGGLIIECADGKVLARALPADQDPAEILASLEAMRKAFHEN